MTSSRWFWAMVVAVAVVLGTLPLRPTIPKPAESPPTDFSADRAMVHVEEIAREPHAMGSPEIVRVRAYLVEVMESLGLEVDQQSARAPDYFFGPPGATIEIVNVVARLRGTDSSEAALFIAHYDTYPTTPGTNDDAVGVAALIETARALTATGPLKNDMIFLFTDAEEPSPRHGANEFISEHPWFPDVGYMVNLEANGRAGASQLVEVGGPEREVVSDFVAASSAPVVYSYITEITKMIGNVGTDFTPFRDAGIPGMHLAYIHGSSVYHTPRDSIANANQPGLQHHGEHILGLALAYGNDAPPSASGDDGANYFTIAPRLTILYSDGWAIGLAVLATALASWALATAGRFRASMRGLGLIAGLFLATLAVGSLLWTMVATLRPEMTVVESYLFGGTIALGLLGAAVFISRRPKRADVLGGLVAFFAVLGLLTALLAPGLSYLFVWPALMGSLLILLGGKGATITGVMTILVLATLHVPWIDFLLQMSNPRPGNPDSQLVPLGGAVFAFLIVAGLLGLEAVKRGREAADSFNRPI